MMKHISMNPPDVIGSCHRRTVLACTIILVVTSCTRSRSEAADRPMPGSSSIVLACPARVEGAGSLVDVGASIDGAIAAVMVHEGDHVEAGQALARLACDDIAAAADQARAAAEKTRQGHRRLLRGSRFEERHVAEAERLAAEAVYREAETHHLRMAALAASAIVSVDARDEARRRYEVAQSSLQSARKREELVDAPALPEEVRASLASIAAAVAAERAAVARVEKCTIASPLTGTVMRRYKEPGEVVTPLLPEAIVSVSDTSRFRVRAEVDERDLGHVFVGQRVLVRADAFSHSMTGRVASIGSLMGRKRVRTGDPAEKSDRDVLEVMVDLDGPDTRPPVGLRVTAQFLAN